MSPPLYLLRVPVRLSQLALYAGDRGWTRRRRADGHEADASFDAGRTLHHVLDETFGPSVLKPFRLLAPRDRDTGSVYAYSVRSKADLLTIANETSMPEADNILELDRMDERAMPASWAEGKRLAFDVLVRPTVRLRTELPNPRPGKKPYAAGAEIDAFLAEAGRRHPDEAPLLVDGRRTSSGMKAAGRTREAVYRDWLAARLLPSADLVVERTTMVAYERERLARAAASIEGPAATFHGELTIADPVAFATLLARGIGRHKSFGFGMLLLRPLRQR
jgi:CRISPR system Cascade subunit CasE